MRFGTRPEQRAAAERRRVEHVAECERVQREQREAVLARIGRPVAGDFDRCACGALKREHSTDPAAWTLVEATGCTYFRRAA